MYARGVPNSTLLTINRIVLIPNKNFTNVVNKLSLLQAQQKRRNSIGYGVERVLGLSCE